MDALAWARRAESLGAGEICLNSIDADGTKDGYDLELTRLVSESVRIPVIASGGAGNPQHMACSWWVNVHGHAHPKIAEAIHRQAAEMEQVIFAGFTHEPAVRLAEKLLELLPRPLSRVFYSDNGSTAVEVALKMAWQYWRNQGHNGRRIFLAMVNNFTVCGPRSLSSSMMFLGSSPMTIAEGDADSCSHNSSV